MIASRPLFSRANPGASQFALRSAFTAALLIASGQKPVSAHELGAQGQMQAELLKGNIAKALALGEGAVAKAPRDAGLRAELGHAYLRAGRFESAASALGDAVALGDTSDRTTLVLALAQIACGQNRAALATLDRGGTIAPADLGLALALAGDTGRGIAVLTETVRDGLATPHLRQNLAYAYALDGRWADAQLTACFDLPPEQVNARLEQWAQSMQSGGERLRIARLLNVPLVPDLGMPAALALNAAVSAPALAVAIDKPEPPAEAPIASSVPVPPAPAPAIRAPTAAPATIAVAVIEPVAAATITAPATPAPPKPLAHRQAGVPDFGHFVQLGAYHSQQSAERGKLVLAKRYPQLRGQGLVVTQLKIQSRSYWLVVVSGLDGATASRTCSSLKRQGGACLAYSSRSRGQGPSLALANAQGAGSQSEHRR